METEPQNDVVISSFCEITSATDQEARFFLESHNWDLDAAVSTFFENDSTDPVPQPPPSHALSPSSSHSPDYSPTRSPTRSRSPSPARPNYHLRPRRAAAAKGSTNPPAARTRGGGIRTLSDLNRRQANDGASDSDDDDDDEPNEYYTGGEKSGMLVQDPTRGGGNDVESIFAQARQFHQDPVEASSSSGSKSFSGTARTLAGETVPAAAPQSINHTVAFWNNGFTVDDGPLRRVDDPANAAFMDSIKKSECPKELEPANRTTTVEVSLIKREEDYREPVKQRNQASFQGVGRTLSASTSESPATESTAAAVPPLTAAPLPSMGLTVDEALPSTSIQLRLADGTRMVSRFNNHHTIGDIHAFIDASRPGGARNYRLQTMGFPPKQLTDLDQTIEQAGAANSVIIQRL